MNRRRFIAGASCPSCGLEDRIVLVSQDKTSWVECIACGFTHREKEAFPEQPASKTEIIVNWPTKKTKKE